MDMRSANAPYREPASPLIPRILPGPGSVRAVWKCKAAFGDWCVRKHPPPSLPPHGHWMLTGASTSVRPVA